ncbi:zinc ribbon-containing protein [Echinimonas agarilytica]|uniref:Zinc-ribbon containing domain-containing protein n=1 Tax=Echinimonas agarilytica TaxID=1215918 RepID=A0AA42B6U9_9GAMM|nr:hypothetical protein [Echinimonas agarilytica]MCM2679090.1 hypothetical protein [Echinimonas agarilytica]
MSDKQASNYQALLEKIVVKVQEESHLTEEALETWLARTNEYLGAAGDLTRDELELIRAYLKRDLQAFADSMDPNSDTHPPSVWLSGIAGTVWHALAEITDKTQVEWRELSDNLAHDGIYQTNEWVALGVIKCADCGHVEEIYHATRLGACIRCGGRKFSREQFVP